jgi:hypothetical protein
MEPMEPMAKGLVPAVTGTDAVAVDEEIIEESVVINDEEAVEAPARASNDAEQQQGAKNKADDDGQSKSNRKWIYCGVCVLVFIVIAIVLGLTLKQEETEELFFNTCTNQDNNATSKFGPAETKLEEPFPGTEQPNFDSAPVYKSFFEQPELYHRLHLHVLSLKRAEDNDENFGFLADDPDAILTVSSEGEDTGSSAYFSIGSYTFPTAKGKEDGDVLFEWDWKGVIIYKPNGTDSFEFSMKDEDKLSSSGTNTSCSTV